MPATIERTRRSSAGSAARWTAALGQTVAALDPVASSDAERHRRSFARRGQALVNADIEPA